MQTLCIELESPWENGVINSVNGKLRDELLKGEIVDSQCARINIGRWRKEHNEKRLRSSLGYLLPTPERTFPLHRNRLALNKESTKILVGI